MCLFERSSPGEGPRLVSDIWVNVLFVTKEKEPEANRFYFRSVEAAQTTPTGDVRGSFSRPYFRQTRTTSPSLCGGLKSAKHGSTIGCVV
ncbi:UNVERIFIED_CONTAM: hypothetical protein NCL1_46126 [Trichonephila clavipes]